MRGTIISTKTVEGCINKVLDKLQANRNEVNIKVIDEPKQGPLSSSGAKDIVVRVPLKDDVREKGTDDFVKNILDLNSNLAKTEQKEDIKVVEDRRVVEEVEEVKSTEDNDEIVETVEIEETAEIEEAEDIKDPEESKQGSEQEVESEESDVTEGSDVTIDGNDKLFITSKSFLKQMIEDMGINYDIKPKAEGNMIKFNILYSQELDIGITIGKRGETLGSLQYIVNLVTNRNANTYIRVISDCNQYRSKRERSLQELARRLAGKAVQAGRNIKPEPMNPYERRTIHTYLQNDENTNTFFQGNEPNRGAIIKRKQITRLHILGMRSFFVRCLIC